MARKKGRPPKSPSTHLSTPTNIPKNLDLDNLDDEDLEEIDDLSPKKAASILKKLDALRAKIKGKAFSDADNEDRPSEDLPGSPANNGKEEVVRKASAWDTFDNTKLRHAGEKLNYVKPGIKDGVAVGKIIATDIESEEKYWQQAIVWWTWLG
ncbi:hypothetical protein RIF29_02069 [Crotalaria pallida]|uniref:Uncharacterized protein n=1 Tax=Crotalaria pallida TaxID=3830 RepID=A0AAN9P7R2_CROPI